MKKKLLALLLTVILVLGMLSMSAFAEETDAFAGTRSVTLTADVSYLENYFIGGRQMLDLALRKGAPQWLNYQMDVENRDISIQISFDFSSAEDYTAKLQMLMMQVPGVLYENGDQTTLLESYSATELLRFVQHAYTNTEAQPEKELSEIFTVTENRITVNSEEYATQEEAMRILPDGVVIPRADELSVDTVMTEAGGYERTIRVRCYLQNEEDNRLETFEQQFGSVGTVTKEEDNTVSVVFSANSDSELSRKTISCLRCINSIIEEEAYADEQTVLVTRTEIFDLQDVLAEGANFAYSCTFAPECRELATENEQINLEENTASATNQQSLTLTYLRGFRFAKLENVTDVTDPLGRITKTLRFYVPVKIASAYHEMIKTKFQDRLRDGMTLNIYDQGGMRCYDISFGAWYPDQIEDGIKAILGREGNKFSLKRGFFPYARNVLREELSLGQVLEDMAQPGMIDSTYLLPDGSIVTPEEWSKARVPFDGFNFFICLLYAGMIIVIAVLAVVITRAVRKKKRTAQAATSTKNPASAVAEEKEEPAPIPQEMPQEQDSESES